MPTTFNSTYETRSVIGKGGMSTVYLAEHQRLHTRWAVKEVRKNQGIRFDFLAESNLLKNLRHPMLPRIVDIFETEEYVYLVEDYVEGISLSELLQQQKKVDEAQGLRWFRDLCGVLNYLHSQTPYPIIYRDMKPSNIMLQPDGTLKLIDFGIAREYKKESSYDTTYAGTQGYAAPEQFSRVQTDARTDIYSLGVTMYHLLTGKSPYEPPYSFVPARQLCPELSHGIEYILNRCIQADPENRYQTTLEVLDDLDHIYRFDDAWKVYRRTKRLRAAAIAVLLSCSIGLIVGGQIMMGQEKEAEYASILEQASQVYTSDFNRSVELLYTARNLFPDRIEPDRQQAYALYLNGQWQECVEFAQSVLEQYGPDVQTRLILASAQFELGDYEAAAQGFAQGETLSPEHMRDYAVCLGRLGQIAQAQQVLSDLTATEGASLDTQYVQGELDCAQENYLQAEESFLAVLEQTDDISLMRRCYVSLGDLYRTCASLARTGDSAIAYPATKSAQLLSAAVAQDGFRYDSALWEMLAMAYFEAYHTDPSDSSDYLTRAADSFRQVLQLGVTKEYLYSNLYTIYYELGDYETAAQTLDDYEAAFPNDYLPHALRGILLISLENEKDPLSRNYQAALAEYAEAGELLRSSDDATYYQQLGSLIDRLRANNWL